jgi:hypothetical protein
MIYRGFPPIMGCVRRGESQPIERGRVAKWLRFPYFLPSSLLAQCVPVGASAGVP